MPIEPQANADCCAVISRSGGPLCGKCRTVQISPKIVPQPIACRLTNRLDNTSLTNGTSPSLSNCPRQWQRGSLRRCHRDRIAPHLNDVAHGRCIKTKCWRTRDHLANVRMKTIRRGQTTGRRRQSAAECRYKETRLIRCQPRGCDTGPDPPHRPCDGMTPNGWVLRNRRLPRALQNVSGPTPAHPGPVLAALRSASGERAPIPAAVRVPDSNLARWPMAGDSVQSPMPTLRRPDDCSCGHA